MDRDYEPFIFNFLFFLYTMRIHISINTTMDVSSTTLLTEIPMDARGLVVDDGVSDGVETKQVITD